jgi:predicted LPLAT superfamily acyltransferase
MQKPWLRRFLKILLVYFIACAPDMWKLAMLGPPVSFASAVFILASSLAAPPVYLYRMLRGEIEYLPAFAPFAVILAIGLVIVWLTERKRN